MVYLGHRPNHLIMPNVTEHMIKNATIQKSTKDV